MIIYSIKIFNFMGFHGEHYRKVHDKDVIGIIGEYKGNQTRSNQSGKSTILEAIGYCFFGHSRAQKEVELIHYGEEVMWVEVVVIDDKGVKYKIKRGRDIKNTGLLEVDFQDKKKEGQESINELLGFDKKEFELTTFFKQSDISQFMELGSAEQKTHIIKWFNISHWVKLEKAVKDNLSVLNNDLKTALIKKEQLAESFENDIDLDVEKSSLKTMLTQAQEKVSIREKKLKKLEAQESMSADEYSGLKRKLADEKNTLQGLNLTNEKVDRLKAKISDNKETIKQLKEENEAATVKESVQELSTSKAQLQQELKIIHDKVAAYESKKGGICPILHEPCDRIQFTEKQYKAFNQRRSEIPVEIDKIDKKLRKINKAKENENTIRELQDSNAQTQESITKLTNGLEVKIKDSEALIAKYSASIKAYNPELDNEKAEMRSKVKSAKAEVDDLQRQLGRLDEKIEAKKRNKAQIKVLSQEIKDKSLEVDDLNYLAMMFGKNGIPSQEIENGFQQVEDDANMILEAMGTGMEIIFRPTRQLDAKEPACLCCGHVFEKGFRGSDCPKCDEPRRFKQKDELNFQVTTSDNSYGFHMDSGGGKSLLATAIRMALTQLKRRMGKCNLNVVFLDEPDSALDAHNAEQFVKMVTNILTKQLGIAQVFWVSHNKDIQSSIPHVLKVIKHEGKATTKWA